MTAPRITPHTTRQLSEIPAQKIEVGYTVPHHQSHLTPNPGTYYGARIGTAMNPIRGSSEDGGTSMAMLKAQLAQPTGSTVLKDAIENYGSAFGPYPTKEMTGFEYSKWDTRTSLRSLSTREARELTPQDVETLVLLNTHTAESNGPVEKNLVELHYPDNGERRHIALTPAAAKELRESLMPSALHAMGIINGDFLATPPKHPVNEPARLKLEVKMNQERYESLSTEQREAVDEAIESLRTSGGS